MAGTRHRFRDPTLAALACFLYCVGAIPSSAWAQVSVAEVLVVEPARAGEPTVVETRGIEPARLLTAGVQLGGRPIPVVGVTSTTIVIVLPQDAEPADLVVTTPEGDTPARPFTPLVAPAPPVPPFRAVVQRPTAQDPECGTLIVVVPDDDSPRRLRIISTTPSCVLVQPITVPWGEDRPATENLPVPTLVVTTSGGNPNRAEVRVRRVGPGPLECFVRVLAQPGMRLRVDRIDFALPEGPRRATGVGDSAPPRETSDFKDTGRPEFGDTVLVQRPEESEPTEADEFVSRWFIHAGATTWVPDAGSDLEDATLGRLRVGIRPTREWMVFVDVTGGRTERVRRLPPTFVTVTTTVGGGGGGGDPKRGGGGGGGGGGVTTTTTVAVPGSREEERLDVWIGRIGIGRLIYGGEDLELFAFAEGGHIWLRGTNSDGGIVADFGLELSLRLASGLHFWAASDVGATRAGNGTAALFEGTLGLRWDF